MKRTSTFSYENNFNILLMKMTLSFFKCQGLQQLNKSDVAGINKY